MYYFIYRLILPIPIPILTIPIPIPIPIILFGFISNRYRYRLWFVKPIPIPIPIIGIGYTNLANYHLIPKGVIAWHLKGDWLLGGCLKGNCVTASCLMGDCLLLVCMRGALLFQRNDRLTGLHHGSIPACVYLVLQHPGILMVRKEMDIVSLLVILLLWQQLFCSVFYTDTVKVKVDYCIVKIN